MNLGEVVTRQCQAGFDQHGWAGPLVAGANVAFLIVAIDAARELRVRSLHGDKFDLYLLIAFVPVIGFASFLFQVSSQLWSRALDIGAIGAFSIGFLAVATGRIFSLDRRARLGCLVGFALISAACACVRCGGEPCLHGTLSYAPALAAMTIAVWTLMRAGHPAARYFVTAGGLFAIALTIRVAGLRLCDLPRYSAVGVATLVAWLLLTASVIRHLLHGLMAGSTMKDQTRHR